MCSIKQKNLIEPASPCCRNCCLNHDDICIGCGRSLIEITGWTKLNQSEKLAVIELAHQRIESNFYTSDTKKG